MSPSLIIKITFAALILVIILFIKQQKQER
jgi:hypothetical protein